MECTRNKLNNNQYKLLKKIQNYLDTPLYFYGSVQRPDYIHNYSDIDIDIFSNNEKNTMLLLQQLLTIHKTNFHNFIYKIYNNKIIKGYKLKYEDVENNIYLELSIYNEKDKQDIISEHNRKNKLPWIITILLIIIKTLYYKLHIISIYTYRHTKDFLMSFCIDGHFAEFVTL